METAQVKRRRNRGLLAPLMLIMFGIVFLLERNGVIDRHTLWQWLPLLPIFIGTWLLIGRLHRRQD